MSSGLGILYPAPTNSTGTFNNDNFVAPTNTALTYATAKQYFLTYPISQSGSQTFLGDINVAGEAYLDGGATIGSANNNNTSFEQTADTLTITNNYNAGQNTINFICSNLLFNGVQLAAGGSVGNVFLAGNNVFTGNNTFNTNPTTFNSPIVSNSSLTISNLTYSTAITNNSSGLVLADGLTISNTTNTNSVLLNADTTYNNQLDIAGSMVATGSIGGNNVNINGGLLQYNTGGGYSYNMSYNILGAVLSKGLQIGNSTNTNVIQLSSDITSNNQLDISGNLFVRGVNISNQLSFNGGSGNILLSNGSAVFDFPNTKPLTNSGTKSGMGVAWNWSGGSGETDLIGYGQSGSGAGGFSLWGSNSAQTPQLIANFLSSSINFYQTPTQPAQSYPISGNDNGSATIGYVNSAIGTSPTIITITSNNSATNGWTFTIPSTNGNYFSYIIYTNNTATTYTKNNAGNPPLNFGTLTSNNSSFIGSGSGLYQPVSINSGTLITYCAGYSQNYTISGSGYGYVLSLVNSNGVILSWSYSSTSITENTGNCPPTSAGSIVFTYTLNTTTPLPSACNVIMKLTKIQ